jgi:DNA-binding transcriptional ArsR family regulator
MRGLAELEEQDRHFAALSHRSRRAVLLVLHANGGTMTSGAIAQRFDCTWQTTSRHLRILEEAGLIHASLRGRERIYQLDTKRLATLTTDFVERFNHPSSAP